ncbi:unnamed protein product [Diamesa serratosioi]
MSLSKPFYSFLGFYFEQLFNNPIRTKSITSCVIATAGSLASQKLTGQELKKETIFAYSCFGLCFGGTVPHYFYKCIENILPDVKIRRILEFFCERFMFAPLFCALSLYFLSIFEGRTHDQSTKNVLRMYKSVLLANWKYLSFPVFLNINFVPSMLRVFVANAIGFFWIIYLSDKRRRAALRKQNQN